jgi:hypothetical protein
MRALDMNEMALICGGHDDACRDAVISAALTVAGGTLGLVLAAKSGVGILATTYFIGKIKLGWDAYQVAKTCGSS